VGLDTPRLALLLLAVEPRLRGIALAAPAGGGKSALIDGFRQLFPDQPVVPLPAGADEEALVGGLDLEATLARGTRVLQAGVLERAHGGALLIESLNLLPESTANPLLAVLDDGALRIERDGLSRYLACRFVTLAGYDPAEGVPRAHFIDRLGLIVNLPRIQGAGARGVIVARHLRPPEPGWSEELALLRDLVAVAREALPAVQITPQQIAGITAAAVALGVQGHRADLFAVLAARASAALALRDQVEEADLETAVRFVLAPRATRAPAATTPPPAPPEATADAAQGDAQQPPGPDQAELGEQVLDAVATELPGLLDALPFAAARRGVAGSRGSTAGTRGRQVSSMPGSPRAGRIDVLATLRAAARWQRLRAHGQRSVVIRADDLRIRRYRSKAGALFLFAVDASGSMALNRMRQAKGAVHALLAQAYVNRDRVALLAFRGETAELLLPPTGSVELLRRAVDQMPTGGGTPLAAALLRSLEVARQARRRGIHNVVLVLLTDARANVGLRVARGGVETELQAVAAAVAAAGLQSLVIDTQRSFLSQGSAQRLAAALQGQYLYLPGASGAAIAAAATLSAAAARPGRERRFA
jgi:magnesium chelatase subunit D